MSSETVQVNFLQQAEIYSAMGNFDRAIALCQQVLELHPNSAEACKTLGKALQAQGKLEDARYWYKVAIAYQPDFAEAFANLGTLCATLEQWSRGDRLLPKSHLPTTRLCRILPKFEPDIYPSRQS